MSRGKTNSNLNLAARKRKAVELFTRGFNADEVAREVGVTLDTAKRYYQHFVETAGKEAAANPQLLRDILKNTVRALKETDQVRQEAWRMYEDSKSETAKSTALSLALKAGSERNKLLQLFGVKAEYMSQVALIQQQQEALIKFLAEGKFCDHDRELIIDFLASQVSLEDLINLPSAAEPQR